MQDKKEEVNVVLIKKAEEGDKPERGWFTS